MHLAGTVAVPQTFPDLGRLSIAPKPPHLSPDTPHPGRDLLVVEHEISPKLSITRTFFLDEVAAVFVPDDPAAVRFAEGAWLVDGEILPGWTELRRNAASGLLGIAYVREQAATLMQVQVGMTAGESVEYYPPLPHDRSIDHYRLGPDGVPVCGTGPSDPSYCGTGPSYCGTGRFAVPVCGTGPSGDEGSGVETAPPETR